MSQTFFRISACATTLDINLDTPSAVMDPSCVYIEAKVGTIKHTAERGSERGATR